MANQEYTNENIMFPPAATPEELDEQRRVAMAAHGMAVVELSRSAKTRPWSYVVGAPLNRRITASTPFTFSGPAAGSDLLKTQDDPTGALALGTLGNCAGGTTPWGTVLSGEENFNGYFRTAGTSAADKRYGLTDSATDRAAGSRSIRASTPAIRGTRTSRTGSDGSSKSTPCTPRRRRSSTRRSGASSTRAPTSSSESPGTSPRTWAMTSGSTTSTNSSRRAPSSNGASAKARQSNKQLLTAGNLYVARFTGNSPVSEITGTGALPSDGLFDGTGEWLPLVVDGASQVAGFTTEQVLVNTRLAADAVGATKMDRCEDVEPHPTTGRVYVACTNNTDRGKVGKEGATEVNPRNSNRDGHIVEITEAAGDATATTFGWSLLLVCGDPAVNASTYFAGFPADKVSPISCPDNVAFDSDGNLWISTDGAPSTIGYCDGLFKVPLEGAERGRVQQFLSVPRESETCGPVIHDRDSSVFVAVQHPGENGTWDAQRSFFPDYIAPGALADGKWGGPRPAVIQTTKV